MNTSLTRRAQEYFEVFDEFHADGYVTHEEWLHTPVKERESIAKMTNQMVQDALAEKGYSRGSPNELLKYRRRWLQARGVIASKPETSSRVLEDPIQKMVESVRQKLITEAEDKIEAASEKAKQKIDEVNERYEALKKELYSTRQALDALQAEHRAMKEESRELLSNLKEAEKKGIAVETQLNELNRSSTELLKNEKKHHEEMQLKNSNTIKRLEEDLKQAREDYKAQLSDLKQQSEDQCHQLIVEIRALSQKQSVC